MLVGSSVLHGVVSVQHQAMVRGATLWPRHRLDLVSPLRPNSWLGVYELACNSAKAAPRCRYRGPHRDSHYKTWNPHSISREDGNASSARLGAGRKPRGPKTCAAYFSRPPYPRDPVMRIGPEHIRNPRKSPVSEGLCTRNFIAQPIATRFNATSKGR